jgi:hypothetical protein
VDNHGGLVHASAGDSRLAPEVQQRARVSLLVLSAAVTVLLGLCWLLNLLARFYNSGTPVTWWHVAVTAVLCAASVGLTAYMVR